MGEVQTQNFIEKSGATTVLGKESLERGEESLFAKQMLLEMVFGKD